jgi:hypothetical protein
VGHAKDDALLGMFSNDVSDLGALAIGRFHGSHGFEVSDTGRSCTAMCDDGAGTMTNCVRRASLFGVANR